MKGVFESRRHKLKYDKIWDVSVALKHLSSLYPNEKLSLKDLMHKVVMLILLVSSQQGQSIHYLDLQHLTMEEDNYFFDVTEHIKTSTPRSPYTRIDIAAYEPNSTICPLSCLRHTALGQHLFPKQMKKTSLSMRSWQRQAGSLQKPFVNITTNQFFKETD